MLTGDNQGTAEAIGAHVGVSDIQSELMPQDKLDYIKKMKAEHGNVAMIGDGVNDAPALAASTVALQWAVLEQILPSRQLILH
ncbi:cadmium translocating P-type ATPase CadA, putative [Staphylococcus aureus]|uniref:Cadmium translocating P-type ATPase CadA, putative n=1 Tax=Staphylococcus aureus TaxID=1280 RepID=A0A2X2K1F1_STAAU|nr:cadmium translocating P-type ATPase CadA, putative [Staphylococcus aureus]